MSVLYRVGKYVLTSMRWYQSWLLKDLHLFVISSSICKKSARKMCENYKSLKQMGHYYWLTWNISKRFDYGNISWYLICFKEEYQPSLPTPGSFSLPRIPNLARLYNFFGYCYKKIYLHQIPVIFVGFEILVLTYSPYWYRTAHLVGTLVWFWINL